MEIPVFTKDNISQILRWVRSIRPQDTAMNNLNIDAIFVGGVKEVMDNRKFKINEYTLGILFSLVESDLNGVDSRVGFSASITIGSLLKGWGDSEEHDKWELADIMLSSFCGVIEKSLQEIEETGTEGRNLATFYGPFHALALIGGDGLTAFAEYYHHYKLSDSHRKNLNIILKKYGYMVG